MGKVKKNRTTTRTSDGMLRSLFSKPLRDRYCKACGRPHLGHVEPIPARRLNLGNVEIQVFESMPLGRLRRELKVQCWNRYRDNWYPQSVFSQHDFNHLIVVVDQALRFMRDRDSSSQGRRLR